MESPFVAGPLLSIKEGHGITGSAPPFGSSSGRTVSMEDKQGRVAFVAAGSWAPTTAVPHSVNVLDLLTRRGWVLSECPGRQEMKHVTRSHGNTLLIISPLDAMLQSVFGPRIKP